LDLQRSASSVLGVTPRGRFQHSKTVWPITLQRWGNKQRALTARCNKEAADTKGDERQAFMKTCLSAEAPQQMKLAACNVKALLSMTPRAHPGCKRSLGRFWLIPFHNSKCP